MIKELALKNRAYRRYDGSYKVDRETLLELIEIARLSSCGSNRQILRYGIFDDEKSRELISSSLIWAGLLTEWPGPEVDKRPSAYIGIFKEKTESGAFAIDTGIAATNILLGAVERGLGGCMFASFTGLNGKLGVDSKYELTMIIAIGKPAEEIVVEDVVNGDVRYYRDEDGVHHVPKRSVEELILK